MPAFKVLTENDVRELERIMDKLRSSAVNPRNRSRFDVEEITAPEVYVALVGGSGIPGLVSSGAGWKPAPSQLWGSWILRSMGLAGGSGPPVVPSSLDCDIYRLLNASLQLIEIKKTVYNIYSIDIPANTLCLVVRDKFGQWYGIPTSSSGGSAPTPFDLIVQGINGTPITIPNVNTIQFNQADNFSVSQPSSNTALIDLSFPSPINVYGQAVLGGSLVGSPAGPLNLIEFVLDQGEQFANLGGGVIRYTGTPNLLTSPVTSGTEGTVVTTRKLQFDLTNGGSLTDLGGNVVRYSPPTPAPPAATGYEFLNLNVFYPGMGAEAGNIVRSDWSLLGSNVIVNDRIWFNDLFPRRENRTVSEIGILVETYGAAGSKCRLGIYKANSRTDLTPGALVYDSGDLALDGGAAGSPHKVWIKKTGLAINLIAGNAYWGCSMFHGVGSSFVVWCVDDPSGSAMITLGLREDHPAVNDSTADGAQINFNDSWYKDVTYGAFPDPITGLTLITEYDESDPASGGSSPLIPDPPEPMVCLKYSA